MTIDNARIPCKAPNFGPVDTAPGAPTAPKPSETGAGGVKKPMPVKNAINFLVKPEEKRKYDALFDQLQPMEGKLGGDKVRDDSNDTSLVEVSSTYIRMWGVVGIVLESL